MFKKAACIAPIQAVSVSLKPPRWKERNNFLALWLGNAGVGAKSVIKFFICLRI